MWWKRYPCLNRAIHIRKDHLGIGPHSVRVLAIETRHPSHSVQQLGRCHVTGRGSLLIEDSMGVLLILDLITAENNPALLLPVLDGLLGVLFEAEVHQRAKVDYFAALLGLRHDDLLALHFVEEPSLLVL